MTPDDHLNNDVATPDDAPGDTAIDSVDDTEPTTEATQKPTNKATTEPTNKATDEAATEPTGTRTGQVRRVAGWVLTVLACLLVLFALVAPDDLSLLTPTALLRIPVEGLVVVALVLVLPVRAMRIVVAVFGVLLGLLTVVKIIDMGFFVAMSRPFDPVLDWALYQPAVNFLTGSFGHFAATATVVGAAVLAVALVLLTTLAVVRLTRIVAGHRTVTGRTIAVLAVIWVVCALTGVQFTAGQPVAARTAAALTYDNVRQVGADLRDEKEFRQQEAVDAFRGTPADQLLTGLRGKNVVLAFVESYGRVAVQDSAFSPQVDAVLDAGTQQLRAAGFDARSAFLTSSTNGGASWLAHSTVQSGLWVDNQQRYDDLLASNRFTLSGAFKRAGWRVVGEDPANIQALPKVTLYDYDSFYDALDVGYRGPNFSYATMPDQYALAAFQRAELAKPNHPPVMAEIDLVSSHYPWAPLPRMVDWNALGNGSIFDPMPAQGTQASAVLPYPDKLRTAYGDSIQYSLRALISYVRTYGDKNLVLVFLGDHQPASLITGQGATRDVPITIVAKDPAVLKQVSGWGWQDGLRPAPNAPVWRMDTFRDHFLSAFSS
jgi:hypothetical protein